MRSIQIYRTLSRTLNVTEISESVIDQFRELRIKSSLKAAIAHIPFLVTLATGKLENWNKSVQRLITEYKRAEVLEVEYLVLHPGSYGDLSGAEGINNIISALISV